MQELGHVIRHYAYGDEDLMQEGYLALRKELSENIRAPPSHLLQAAKYAICGAYSRGRSVDSRKAIDKSVRDRGQVVEVISPDFQDSRYLEAPKQYRPDVLAIDRIAYGAFRENLTPNEELLLELMKDGLGKGKGGANYRDRFFQETGASRWTYEKTYASLRMKFYRHFGEEHEMRSFEQRYDSKLRMAGYP